MYFQPKVDLRIFIPSFFLFVLGITTIYSIAPTFFPNQVIYGFLALFVFTIFSSIDYQVYKNISGWLYILSVLFLVVTEFMGVVSRGSLRWIDFGIIRLQPSELIKPLMMIYLASQFKDINSLTKIIKISLFFLLPVILIARQPDLGNAMVFVFFLSVFIFVSRIKPFVLFSLVALLSSIILLFAQFLKDYQKQRIISFINPGFDPLGAGYNAIQSMMAVGSGNLFGRGLGQGIQSHLLFLPEFHTDFVFASFSEEWGFVGSSLIISLYFFLLFHLFKTMNLQKDSFGRFLLLGTTAIIFVQMFINIGMNMGILPITGITLPLVSYGGSSVISTAILLGIASNVCQNHRSRETIVIS